MGKYTIPNLKNACRVIELLSVQGAPLTIETLSQQLSVPRTSMLRILSTLEEAGFVERRDKQFVTGGRLLQLGLFALKENNLRVLAAPVLAALSQATGETAHIAQLSGRQMLILEVCESQNTVRAAVRAGTLVDIHCSATGKVILANTIKDVAAFLEDVALTPRTENTKVSIEEIVTEIPLTLERGYGLDDIEYVEGVRCLAAPIRNAFGEVIAAVGISASIMTFTRGRIDAMAQKVCAAADELSQALGG